MTTTDRTSDASPAEPLAGQHAFITGGGSGIGLGIARSLAADGAAVTIAGRSEERLESARDELLGGGASSVELAVVDVGAEDAVSSALTDADARVPLSIVVANAGRGTAGPLEAVELDEWESTLRTNLTGAFLTVKHAARLLVSRGGGTICAVSSIAGTATHRFMTPYTVSKAGLDMLVRNAADELGSRGVRVNAVAPGLVETELSALLQSTDEVDADYRINMPLGRRGTPEDVARAVRFLCGPESSWITGVVLAVDGGHHLRRGPNIDPLLAPFVPDLAPPSPPAD
ncbi:MAG: SDR family oxidoreductase [Actinomycetota bacterium]